MTYEVTVTREGDAWLADVPKLEGAHTWARNLPALEAAVREVIALAEDLPDGAEDGLTLDMRITTGDEDLDRSAAELRRQRAIAAEIEAEAALRTEELVTRLVSDGYSMRDTAVLSGVSFQRVSQLAARRGLKARKVRGRRVRV